MSEVKTLFVAVPEVKPAGWPRVTPPDHPADPRSKLSLTSIELAVEADKPAGIAVMHPALKAGDLSFTPSYVVPFHPMEPWNLPPIGTPPQFPPPWKKRPRDHFPWGPGIPFDPPWEPYAPIDPFTPIPPTPEQEAEKQVLLRRLMEAAQAGRETGREAKIRQKKEADMVKIVELEQKVVDLEARLKAIELHCGLVKPPEPIIPRGLFQAGHIKVASPDDDYLTEGEITLAAIRYHGLSIEAWNDLTDDERITKTVKYILFANHVPSV